MDVVAVVQIALLRMFLVTKSDSPGCFILEGSVVQPQLQVMRPLSYSNVELLGAAQYVLVLAFTRRVSFFIIRRPSMLWLQTAVLCKSLFIFI